MATTIISASARRSLRTSRGRTRTLPKKKPPDAPREQSRKLSFKERKELESLPGRIELLENAVQELHAAMADPSFYRKDRDEIAGARNRLEDLEREMASAYAPGTPWKSLPADSRSDRANTTAGTTT